MLHVALCGLKAPVDQLSGRVTGDTGWRLFGGVAALAAAVARLHPDYVRN